MPPEYEVWPLKYFRGSRAQVKTSARLSHESWLLSIYDHVSVNWDLIPQAAIAEVDLIPGSNPIFGLNTLGGALSVHTKRGRDFPGTTVGASGGSFERWAVEAEHGGFHGPFDWYLAFNALHEDGWRDQSPSTVRQLFATVGWEAGGTALNLNYIWADNDLVGNGLVPESTLARDRVPCIPSPIRPRTSCTWCTCVGVTS